MARRQKQLITRTCVQCHKQFETRNDRKAYCRPACRWQAWDRRHPRMRREEGVAVGREACQER